ncbi:hypothetical protein ACM66B_005576 [Microbotryomycetes sp. NB124-2]
MSESSPNEPEWTAQSLHEQLEHAYAVRHGAQALLDKLDQAGTATRQHASRQLDNNDNVDPETMSAASSSALDVGSSSSNGHVPPNDFHGFDSSTSQLEDTDTDELKRQVASELHDASDQIAYLEQRLQQLEREQNQQRQPVLSALDVPDDSGNLSGSLPSPALSANSFDNYPFLNKSVAAHSHQASDSTTYDNSQLHDYLNDDQQQQQLIEAVQQAEKSLDMLKGLTTNPFACVKAIDDVVNVLKSNLRVKLELELDAHLPHILHCLSDRTRKEVRANVFRLLRHLVVDQHDVEILHAHRLDIYLVRSFARDSKFELEKEQALRLVRTLMVYSIADVNRIVPVSVIRAVVSIAENTEDRMRLAALETLGELLLRDVSLLAHAGGLRIVLQALSEGPFDLSPLLTQCFIYIMDNPGTRQYLRPGVDVEVVLASFTEINVKGFQQEERVRVSARNTLTLLKSWSGLLYFNLYNRRPLRTLVESLTNPVVLIRDTLIDMFFNLFNVKTPTWYQSKLANALHNEDRSDIDGHRVDLGDQYLSIVLLMFIEAGLLEGLAVLATKTRDAIPAKAVSLLIGEVLQLANRVLPLDHAARAQALPKLFELTTTFDTSDERLTATNTLTSVDTFNRLYGQSRHRFSDQASRPRSESSDNPLRSGQRQVEHTRQQMNLQIDDNTFRTLLLETGVLSTKDHDKWNVEMVRELVEGPLLNPKRLDEAMRASKFMRRLMSFFQPFQYRYSDMRKSRHNVKYTQLGCSILSTLLANPDGVRYLNEDKLLPQIADCLAQLDPSAGRANSAVLLSRPRMETTMVGGYFEMLGTLSKHPEGLKLLNQLRIFSSFYRISELRGRDDLFRAVLVNLDYSNDGHARVLLSKALTASHKTLRAFATQLLTTLIFPESSGPSSAALEELATTTATSATSTSRSIEPWQIRLAVTQIYDPAPEVCAMSVKLLERICRSSLKSLETVVELRPSLDHLGHLGIGLLTRFLATTIGVSYLSEIGFVHRMLDDWYYERNDGYVIQVELQMAAALGADDSLAASARNTPTKIPPHFYGELVKTEEGCNVLDASGHFAEFAEYLRQHAMEDFDEDVIFKLKSVLWAVGHVGSTDGGLEFLDQEDILETIVDIAEESPVFSLRGTAFFALGLISSTIEGAEMLEDLGWQAVLTPLGQPTTLVVPMELGNFVDTTLWTPPAAPVPRSFFWPAPTSHTERHVLSAISNLSNHILAAKASKTIARTKQRHPHVFKKPEMVARALELLSCHHYRANVRKFVVESFSLGVFEGEEGATGFWDDEFVKQVAFATDRLNEMSGSVDVREEDQRQLGDVADEAKSQGPTSVRLAAAASTPVGIGSDADTGQDTTEWSNSSDGENTDEEGKLKMPVKVMKPALTVKGFLLS